VWTACSLPEKFKLAKGLCGNGQSKKLDYTKIEEDVMTAISARQRGRRDGFILCAMLVLSVLFLLGCSNPKNSLNTGKIIKGFIASGQPNAKWMYMDDDAVILLDSGNEGKLHFKGLVDPNVFKTVYNNAFTVTFIVNGVTVNTATVTKLYDGYFDVVSDVPKNAQLEVHIKTDKYDPSIKGVRRSMIAYSLEAT
jgi:hypothetical protein